MILSDFKTAKTLIETYHYSGSCPVGAGFIVVDQGKPVAAAVFGNSSGRRNFSGRVVELRRLVKVPGSHVVLTSFLSRCLKNLRHVDTKYHLVLAYADPAQNHHGGVYQACSWNYHGLSAKGTEGFMIDGEYVYRRNLYDMYGTSSFKKLQELLPDKTVEHARSGGKHVYWKNLTIRGSFLAKELGLRSIPYWKETQ